MTFAPNQFTVHMIFTPGGIDVFLRRNWLIDDKASSEHDLQTYDASEQNRAEVYAMCLAETHGDCAVCYS